jgi:hypothetical protein
MRRALMLLTTIGLLAYLASPAHAKTHIQNISYDSAKAYCKNHGGGTDCHFCAGNHCHQVGCGDNKKGCFNYVDPAKGKPSGIRTGVDGTKAPPSTTGSGGPRRPVNIGSGLKPIVYAPVSSGGRGGGMHEGSGGGGMNQGSGHHR